MLRAKRIEAMERYIVEYRQVSLDQLCDAFSISKNTVRRDIDELRVKGGIKKIYGGVSITERENFLPFHERETESGDAKKKIASAAAALVEDGDVIFVDSGTTASRMVDGLADKRDITVLTNNLDFINAAVHRPRLEIISLSGILNRTTLSFSGGSAVTVLSQYNIAKSFMAAVGVSLTAGATNYIPGEYELKSAVMAKSRTKILLADRTKLGTASLQTFAHLDAFQYFVTDGPLDNDYSEYFATHGVIVILAK